MNNPKNHHYVPQVYLQRFAINQVGDIYRHVINTKFDSKPKLVNKSSICFEKNMYKYKNIEHIAANEIDDVNYIEKNTFVYENNELSLLFDKIDHRKKLFKSEYVRLLQIILNIKKRNPFLRKEYLNSERDNEIMESKTEDLTKKLLAYGLEAEEVKTILNNAKSNLLVELKNEDYRKDMYRNSILAKEDMIINNNKEVVEYLESWNTKVFQTTAMNPFITSDNPGFTIKDSNKVFNTNLKFVDSFVFPISPRSILFLSKNNNIDKRLLYREIDYKQANKDLVLFFNSGTYMTSMKIIISGSNNQLTITKNYNKD
jgi:hypothetical protein